MKNNSLIRAAVVAEGIALLLFVGLFGFLLMMSGEFDRVGGLWWKDGLMLATPSFLAILSFWAAYKNFDKYALLVIFYINIFFFLSVYFNLL